MTQQTENYPAQLLFDLLLRQIREIVQVEIATLREGALMSQNLLHSVALTESDQKNSCGI
jgi:hypothetical protein